MFLPNFINYTDAQDIKLDSVKGLIIYPNDSAIPQDVLFIPTTRSLGGSFNEFVKDVLKDSSSICYVTYFQGIRWIMQDLKEVIDSLKYEKGTLSLFLLGKIKKVRVSYGIIVFNKDQLKMITEPVDRTPKPLTITFDGLSFEIHYVNMVNDLGIPKGFQKIEF
jgi:hypothetical protein